MVTKEKLEAELKELLANRTKAYEMMLRYDGAIQAVDALLGLCADEATEKTTETEE